MTALLPVPLPGGKEFFPDMRVATLDVSSEKCSPGNH